MKRRGEMFPAFFTLPVQLPEVDWMTMVEDPIGSTYVKERQGITRKNIRKFVERWRGFQEIMGQLGKLAKMRGKGDLRHSAATRLLLSKKLNTKRLYRELKMLDDPNLQEFIKYPNVYTRAALELLIPTFLLHCFQIAQRYGVPHTMAQVRVGVHLYPEYEGWGY